MKHVLLQNVVQLIQLIVEVLGLNVTQIALKLIRSQDRLLEVEMHVVLHMGKQHLVQEVVVLVVKQVLVK